MGMSRSWLQALQIELKMAHIIHQQAQNGWLFDKDKCSAYIEELGATMNGIYESLKPSLPITVKQYGVTIEEPFKMDRSLKKMVTDWTDEDVLGPFTRIYFEDFNLGSDKQVKEFLLTVGWKPTWWNFRKKDSKEGKKGDRMSPKLSDKGHLCPNLDELDGELGQNIATYLKCKHRKSLLEGLLKVVRPDGRIPAEANTIGAATHRMTHRKIVNIPGGDSFYGKEIRSLFITKAGYSIVGCDSKSNQMRMLAHYLGIDEKHPYGYAILKGTKAEGNDCHCVAAESAGLESRSGGKTLNYSLLFGQGDASTAKALGKSTAQTRAVKDRFFSNIPELPILLNNVKKAVRVRGFLYGLDGRKIYCSSEHKALNYLLQSAEAVYMKYSQAILARAIEKEGLDAKFIATIHDEYQLEVKDEHVKRVSELCLWAMEKAGTYLNISVPMEGDVNVGKNWSETH